VPGVSHHHHLGYAAVTGCSTARLAPESRARVESLRWLITAFDFEIDL
jgi:transposase